MRRDGKIFPSDEFPIGAKVAARSASQASPLSDVPLQEIAQQVASGRLKAKPSRVFAFEEIHEAHRVMEANEAGGKMVVVIG
ncbi:MAG: zinc-binding dehydrogenase [Methylocella sp.]